MIFILLPDLNSQLLDTDLLKDSLLRDDVFRSYFKEVDLGEILQSIIQNNQKIGNLSEDEKAIQLFLIRFSQLYKDGKSSSVSTSGTLPLWRGLFEVAVCFRLLVQPILENNDVKLFSNLITRFKDLGELLEWREIGFYKAPYQIKEIEKKYRLLSQEDKTQLLVYEYDWLNPIFTKKVLKETNYHPSFKDLVNRTRETNYNLIHLYPNYQTASQLLHFNFGSVDLANQLNSENKIDLSDLYFRITQEFLISYFYLITELYKNSESKQAKYFSWIAKHSAREIERL